MKKRGRVNPGANIFFELEDFISPEVFPPIYRLMPIAYFLSRRAASGRAGAKGW
jgi:hypothetical protein